MAKSYYVYILASGKEGTLYIGVSGNLAQRIEQHRNKSIKSFTSKYGVDQLVYVECFEWVHDALSREKHLKNWKREWKIHLIEKQNPEWKDLLSSGLLQL